ncbi:MAG TPA: hypothetical protein VEX36_07700 [Thermoleophilaceae bacterium]|nr:hypothetical protein [Thermoleophilaceae bacterium]
MAIGKMTRKAFRTACVALAAAALAPALAAADVEPNNSVFDPEGPILAGQDYGGTLSSSNQDDWYVLYTDTVQQLHLSSAPATAHPCLSVGLTDADGEPIAPDYTSRAGTTRFFVHVSYTRPLPSGCPPELSYSFRIDSTGALVTGPGKLPVKGTREPNETLEEAGGPLVPGTWYFSRLETVNDHDWLHFYVRPGAGLVDVETVTFGGESCAAHQVILTDARGDELTTSVRRPGVIEHLTAGVGRSGAKLFVHSFGPTLAKCVGASAVVKVGPDDAIMTRAQVKATCSKGRNDARRWARRVAADKRAIARAEGSPSRAQKRRLASDRRKLKRARRAVGIYC